MIKACIFDLDGVLVDTAKYHFEAWKRLADELGITITAEDNEKLKGVGRLESLDIILSMVVYTLTKQRGLNWLKRRMLGLSIMSMR